jgi:hypothetical protein
MMKGTLLPSTLDPPDVASGTIRLETHLVVQHMRLAAEQQLITPTAQRQDRCKVALCAGRHEERLRTAMHGNGDESQ